MPQHFITGACAVLAAAALAVAGSVAFGGPKPPPVNAALSADDEVIRAGLSDQPPAESFRARDGVALWFRRYSGAAGGGMAVLVHGSSGSNNATHLLAKALAGAGVTAIAIDVRGHGASGPHGDIAYVGQLDDDIADLARVLEREAPREKRLLIGHSSGGGFALRIAGGKYACAFDGFIALSPYLNYRSDTNRPDAGWANVGAPRIIGLSILDAIGVKAFDGLPALAFAIPPNLPRRTAFYSWRLMRNFGLDMSDWEAELKAIDRPTRVIAGSKDQLFFADRYKPTFARLAPAIPVEIVANVTHMGMVADPPALAFVAQSAKAMLAATSPPRCVL